MSIGHLEPKILHFKGCCSESALYKRPHSNTTLLDFVMRSSMDPNELADKLEELQTLHSLDNDAALRM